LKPPSPLEFPLTFLGVGMDIFWNYTIHTFIYSCFEKGYPTKPYATMPKDFIGNGIFMVLG